MKEKKRVNEEKKNWKERKFGMIAIRLSCIAVMTSSLVDTQQ